MISFLGLGAVYVKQFKFDFAEPYLSQAVKIDPKYPQACFFLGESLAGNGRFKEVFQFSSSLFYGWPMIIYNFVIWNSYYY